MADLRCRRRRRRNTGAATFDDLIQLTAIKPNTATLRAIINLDTLPVAHRKGNGANRALHSMGMISHADFLQLRIAARRMASTDDPKMGSKCRGAAVT